ncbi:hypothetical protein Z043_123610, partial [Scleropages formosus]
MKPNLHKPIFLLHLAINGVIGSTSVCPKIMDLLISNTEESCYEDCLEQMFFINFYPSSAYAILTAMAYDRHLMSRSHEIALGLCLAQIYCLHTYGFIEFCILAVMSYDRYIAVCPLPYHMFVSTQNVVGLIVLSWTYLLTAFGL